VERETQKGFAIWITGLPASGKSAVTAALVAELKQRGIHVAVLESDVLRRSFSTEREYEEQDREYFYASLAFIGKVLTEHDINVIFDATANRRSYRDRARRQISRFAEVYVDTPLDVCIQRDPKGIYRRGKAGLSHNVPGLQADYEPPLNPDLVIHGNSEDPRSAAERIAKLLEVRAFLGQPR
jgi:adenylylsulfate kinase